MLNVNHHQIDDLIFLHYFIKTIRPLGPFSKAFAQIDFPTKSRNLSDYRNIYNLTILMESQVLHAETLTSFKQQIPQQSTFLRDLKH